MPSRRAIAAGPSFSSSAQPPDFAGVDRRLAALVDAARLRGGDPFELPLAAQIGLEFGEHAEHVEERLAGSSAGVDRLLGRLQRDALGLQLVYDVLQVFQRTRQAIDAGDDKRVAGSHEVEQHLQFAAAVARVPLAFSARITSQPAAFSAARWIDRSWSRVETRA